MKKILILCFSILIAQLLVACSRFPLANNHDTEQAYQLNYHRFTYGLQPVDDSFVDDGLNLIFPLVSGSIFGAPSEEILQISPANAGTFTFVVPQKVDGLAGEIDEQGLSVVPADTRILRMGTFHAYPYYQTLGDGGFINGKNGNALVFTYFSKAVAITGKLFQYGEVFEHELNIQGPGWYWLEISKQGGNSYLIRPYDGTSQEIYFAVLLDEMAAMR